MNDYHNSIEFRRDSLHFFTEMQRLISFCTKALEIDAIDWHVYTCVMYYSVKNGSLLEYNDPYFEKDTEYKHGVINAKSIYLTLGMPRETVRKRLVFLENRGAIEKDNNGYVVKATNDFEHLEKYNLSKPYLNIRTYLLSLMKRGWERRMARLNLNDPFPYMDINSIGFRQETVSIMCTFFLAVTFCMKELSLDALNLQVLMPVYINSALNGYLFKDGASIDSNHEVGVVSAETIQIETGMARETIRRRLLELKSLGLIKKVKNGYEMIPQYGEHDKTSNIRKYILNAINSEMERVDNVSKILY